MEWKSFKISSSSIYNITGEAATVRAFCCLSEEHVRINSYPLTLSVMLVSIT